jgi:ABC-type polysaccharide/polyol phosphate transport system ATPase subunit
MGTVIELNGISKKFSLPREKEYSLRNTILNLGKSRKYQDHFALNDITFRIEQGEFIGIIGRNGSGKSLLLKLIAGIIQPSEGHINVDGKVLPFLELGFGSNAELTGRDNIFLYGAILGFGRKEIRERFADIVRFAELERYIDQKLKYYSTGMQLRLAFAVSVQVKASIFLIDEVMAVGDAGFQKKCETVFRYFREEGKTIMVVSHDLGSIENWCDRTMLLDEGYLIDFGDTGETIRKYVSQILGKRQY